MYVYYYIKRGTAAHQCLFILYTFENVGARVIYININYNLLACSNYNRHDTYNIIICIALTYAIVGYRSYSDRPI